MSSFALVSDGKVVATGEDNTTLAALGAGAVVALDAAASAAVRAGLALELVGGVPVESLAAARVRAWERAKAARDAAEFGGCETPSGRADTSRDSIMRLNGAVAAAQIALAAGQPFSLDWTLADNSVVALDAPATIALGLAAMAHIVACHERGRELRAAIAGAADLAALAAIDVTAGWP